MFKSVCKLVLVLSLLLTVTPAVSTAQNENVIVNESFEGTPTVSLNGNYSIVNSPSSVNKAVGKGNTTGNSFDYSLDSAISEGYAVVSHDIRIDELSDSRLSVWDNGSSSKRIYYYNINSTSLMLMYNNKENIATIELGKWFNLTQLVDFSDKKVYTYIDGVLKGNGYDFLFGGGNNISKIQFQHGAKPYYMDNAYIATYETLDEAQSAIPAKKLYIAQDFEAGTAAPSNWEKATIEELSGEKCLKISKGDTGKLTVGHMESGAEVVSYDIYTGGNGSRLMQIYDSNGKRSVLIQLNSANKLYINESVTSTNEFKLNEWNNVTLIFDNDGKKFDVYLNNVLVVKDRAAWTKDSNIQGINISYIQTQTTSGSDIYVDNVSAVGFESLADARTYAAARMNVRDMEALAYYGAAAEDVENAINGYTRQFGSLRCTSAERQTILTKLQSIMPYKSILTDNFESYDVGTENITGYTASANNKIVSNPANASEKVLQLTNSGSRARLLKQVSSAESFTVTEASFMQEQRADVNYIMRVTDASGNEAGIIRALNGDIFYVTKDGIPNQILISNYETNRWYNFKMCTDYTTKKCEVYVDGASVGKFDFYNSDAGTLVRVFDSYTDSVGTYYIDNVKVYTDELAKAAMGAVLPKKANANLTMPEISGYSTSWTSSADEVISSTGVYTQPESTQDVTMTLRLSNGILGIDKKMKVRAVSDNKFELGNIVYADQNEYSTDDENGAKGIKGIYVNDNYDIAAKLIVAKYDASNRLVGVSYKTITDGYNTVGLPISGEKVKVFIWGDDLTPYLTKK